MLTLLKRITDPATLGTSPTIRDTSVTVDEVHQELMARTPQKLIQEKYPDLDEKDIQAVWVHKAIQNSQDGVVDRQELISSLGSLPEKISLLQVYDHVDLLFQIQRSFVDMAEGKGTPHEQVMQELRDHGVVLKRKQA